MLMSDVIIIGKGPAGISASLYAARAGLSVLVIGRPGSSLEKADKIENYYGLETPLSGKELLSRGFAQAQRLGVGIIDASVTELGFDDTLFVKADNEIYKAPAVVIASGAVRKTAPIRGLADFEGRGVSYCAVCDGYFHKGKDVAVLGAGQYALSEAHELLPLAKSVTLLTNGEPVPEGMPGSMTADTRRISEIFGSEHLEGVLFSDGAKTPFSGVFVAMGNASVADLARKLGIEVKGSSIVADGDQATNVPGVFAAGDCTGGMLQVAKAVHEGAQAGLSAVKYVRSLKK
jgi:thioredoxin reductase (NADPH)